MVLRIIMTILTIYFYSIIPQQLYAQEETSANTSVQLESAEENQDRLQPPPSEKMSTFEQALDNVAGFLVNILNAVLFFPVGRIPAIVLWLLTGATILTFYMGFINFRAFRHAIQVTRGKFTSPEEAGEVTHFQALSSALSATVGLGNIAGVAIAITIGGPGATFWMILAGLLGMSSKFTECSLGQMYRQIGENGKVSGGPMHYLSQGLKERGFATLGKILAFMFAILCVVTSFGGGNMFQVNQSLGAIANVVPSLRAASWLYGLIMAAMVGIVIIGGIKRIGQTAEKIVPLMCGIYVVAALSILFVHYREVPDAFGKILAGAFTPEAGFGGFIGVMVQGFRRATFSNEAGIGSAPIAHSAAKTSEPIREGIVALLEPFIDTIVICTMTALVIIITGAYHAGGEFAQARAASDGALLTTLAFQSKISWFPYVLSIAVMLFAYSTMISWSYYGERCWAYLFSERSTIIYKCIFLVFIVIGSVISSVNVINFSDLMIFSLSFPNILGIYILAPRVKRALGKYMNKLNTGEFTVYK